MNSAISFAMTPSCVGSLMALPSSAKKRVETFIEKLMHDPASPGLNYEKLRATKSGSLWSVRIDRTYRGIMARQPETGTYVLAWVDHHDEAYAWAKTHECSINEFTGAVQIYTTNIQNAADDLGTSPSADKTLFGHIREKDLLRIGVPEELLGAVRNIRNAHDLDLQKKHLPDDVAIHLELLAEGCSLEDVYELMDPEGTGVSQDTTVSDDMAAALQNPLSQMNFIVIDDNEELRRIMNGPLEKWRVFLHPTQRALVRRNFNGAACVLGGAGTGKTVVAMHRAHHLASGLGEGRILVTTFTKTLTADLQDNLKKICTPDEMRKIDIQNLDAWAVDYLNQCGITPEILYHDREEDRLTKLWHEAMEAAEEKDTFPSSFCEEEYNRVVLPYDAFSLDEYLAASRAGRGKRLSQKQKEKIWRVFAAYRQLMTERNVRDIESAMNECTRILAETPSQTGYRHVIVDETQDFNPNALRMIRAIAGEEHPNDLFLVGDARQRIYYKNKAVLRQCGIHVRGRSSELRVNYRTTAETRDFALAVLDGTSFDNLDAEESVQDLSRSMTHGPAPKVMVFTTADEEFEAVYAEIQKLVSQGVAERNICIVARTNRILSDYVSRFRSKGMRCYELKDTKHDDEDLAGIRIATMHRVKGLEFEYIFVVAANTKNLPHVFAIDKSSPEREADSIAAEKCLLHVALTRAQKRAYVSCYGEMSDFLRSAVPS